MATAEERRRAHATDEWRRARYEQSPEREALFTTMSGLENEPLYTPSNVEIDYDRDLGYPGAFPYTRGVYPSMYRGRLWTMRQFAGFGTAEETNARFRYLRDHGQTGLSTAFDMPTLMGYDSDHPRSLGEVGREGVAIDSLEDMEQLFAGIPLGEVSTSMTINAPAAMLLAFYICVAEEQGVPAGPFARDDPDGHPQGVHRPEGVDLPARALDAALRGHDRVLRAARPALAPGLDLGLPHPRGRLDGRPGARLHPGRRLRLRGGGHRARPRRGRLRAAALLLLQRAHRLLRGGREVPCRAPHLGEGAARALRGQEPSLVAHALPRPDRWRLPHRSAAGGEHRADGARGPRRGPRRLPVAAHELLRRGPRAADRARGEARAPHPAGDRARDRGGEHHRPARRVLLPRGPDQPARSRRPTTTSLASGISAASSRRSRRTSSSARSPMPPSASRARSRPATGSSSASTGSRIRTSARSRS